MSTLKHDPATGFLDDDHGIGGGYPITHRGILPGQHTRPGSCGRWLLGDKVRCPAAGGIVAIQTARQNYHSFGGIIPIAPKMIEGDQPPYPESAYCRPENKATCDGCSHQCMDG